MRKIFNEDDYFCWLASFVPEHYNYNKLINVLYNKEFSYIFVMDGNRAEDGIGLRYRFESDYSYDSGTVTKYFENKPCSVLEMIVALALRCEESIMYDSRYGDRTSFWIGIMLSNMGLDVFNDIKFDFEKVNDILNCFINRQYSKNGDGSLFRFKRDDIDVRSMEIWIQMNWYLNEYY